MEWGALGMYEFTSVRQVGSVDQTLECSGTPASSFIASMTISPPTIAFVVAIAWIMLPAIPCAKHNLH